MTCKLFCTIIVRIYRHYIVSHILVAYAWYDVQFFLAMNNSNIYCSPWCIWYANSASCFLASTACTIHLAIIWQFTIQRMKYFMQWFYFGLCYCFFLGLLVYAYWYNIAISGYVLWKFEHFFLFFHYRPKNW